MVWDDDKCIKRNTNEKHSTICLCRRRGHFAILVRNYRKKLQKDSLFNTIYFLNFQSSNKTTIREDIRNIINIQLPNLIRKINDTIYDEKDVENFMKSILADLSGNFMYSFIKTTVSNFQDFFTRFL